MGKVIRNIIIFLLPALILFTGIFLYSRFLKIKPASDVGRIPEKEGVQIEDRTSKLLTNLKVSKDHTVELKPINNDEDVFGAVSWTKDDSSLSITVTALLPDPNGDSYVVWLTQNDTLLNIGTLTLEKGGYILDYIGDASLMKYSGVVISKESRIGYQITDPVLEGEVTF